MDRDYVKGEVAEENVQMQVNPYVDMTIDELLSRYAIAFKEGDIEAYTNYRGEIVNRVGILRNAQYALNKVRL